MTSRGPQLLAVTVADDAASWRAAGFVVEEADGTDVVRLGSTAIALGHEGPMSWALAGIDADQVAGVAVVAAPTVGAAPSHPNGVSAIDHLVVFTGNLDATIDALTEHRFELRRVRDVPGSSPARRQAFVWAGDVILEIVGNAEPEPGADGSAVLWGLALTCVDLDATADLLGERVGGTKAAVQSGRRIATLRTRELGISVPVALMSPHPGR